MRISDWSSDVCSSDLLAQREAVLAERDWLVADRFTVADLLMADVLRVPDVRARGERPASEAYVARVTARPAFGKAHADQLAHFAAADEARSNRSEEHTSELQSLMRISYAVFCLKKKKKQHHLSTTTH